MSEIHVGPRSQRNRRKKNLTLGLIIASTVLFVLAIVFVVIFAIRNAPPSTPTNTNTDASNQTTVTDTTDTDEEDDTVKPISFATISVTGDILTHTNVINAAKITETGEYVFDPFFAHVKPYISAADYAVTNLEVTLAGTENGRTYTGYPRFNSPDSLATGLKNAGFDMAMTANNHCYDTGLTGLHRTLQILTENGLDTLGTVSNVETKKYVVKEINDIKIGMISYTFETGDAYPDRPSINGLLTSENSVGLINSFDYKQLDKFYAELEENLSNMKADGAEATVLYIHWGNEYQLSPASSQKEIAQKICDLGIDVIVGGHPHVIQPMDLLESTVDENHKTICLFSCGNFISNQRRNLMNLKTGHTEDGIMFSFSFTKYSDGTVALEQVDAIPTWVWLHKVNGQNVYSILPLDQGIEDWKAAFSLDDVNLNHATESYQRTMALIEEGLMKSKNHLEAEKLARLAAYETKE
ncbi:MAG: CapA family protein [Clostridia bacterium]|nr:CapA family protein [Clostridia bacterium]